MAIKFLNTLQVDTDVLYVDAATNKVGIGTTNPSEKLTVNGVISTTTSDFVLGATGSRLLLHTPYSGDTHSYIQAQDSTGSNADLALQLYGGKVGIGTASPSSELEIAKPSGFSTLTLSSSANINYGGGGIINIKGGISDYTSFALNVQTANGTQEASMGYSAGSGRTWAFDADQRGVAGGGHTSYNFKNNGSSQMVIYNNNVGIGTTNPLYKLQVGDYNAGDGNIAMKANGTGINAGAELTFNMQVGGGNANSYIAQIVPRAYDSLSAGTHASLNFKVGAWNNNADAGVSRMTILSNGNVGIGTTNPGTKLEVEGHGIFNGSVVINENIESLRLGTTEASGGTYQTWHNASGRKGFFGYAATVNDIIYLVNDENSSIQLGTNGRVADFLVFGNGNIGLGNTSPGVKLVTNTQNYSEGPTLGSGVVGGQALLATNGAFGQYSGVSGTTGHVWHQVQRNDSATAYNMILQPAGGNVGIGTDSPGDKLVVQGDGDGILVRSNDFTLSRLIPRGGTSTNWDKALFSLYNAATESVRIDTAGKSWFNGGFVGIGNTAPSQLFHVENTQSGTWTTRFSNTVANSNNIYFGLNTGSTSYGMYIDGGLGAAGFDIQTSGGFAVRGNGKVGIGVTNPFARLSVESPYFSSGVCADFKFTGPQSNYYGMTNIKAEVPLYGTGIRITSPTSASNDNQAMSFYQQTSFVGSISLNTSSTSYNTTSDYRLKENREEILDAIERVKELKPAKFNWIKEPEGKKVDGFYAHELAEVIPESVTGEKDALDYEGNPNYQSVDQSKVVPLLAAALQQAISKIEKLESRILTLENK